MSLFKMARPSSCWRKLPLPRSSRRRVCRQTCAKHLLWLASLSCAGQMAACVASSRAIRFVALFRKHSPGSGPRSLTMPRRHFSLRCRLELPSPPTCVPPLRHAEEPFQCRWLHYSMSRAAFFSKLREVAPELLPFVPLFYGSPSTCCWWDSTGRCRDVAQGEGCEQGDSFPPALFALGQHDALQKAAEALHADDSIVAFLDDNYVVTMPSGATAAFDATVRAVEDRDASNLGKTWVIVAEAGSAPAGIAEPGDDVWRSDKPHAQRGVVVLGSPLGHPAFVQAWAEEKRAAGRARAPRPAARTSRPPVRMAAFAFLRLTSR